MKSSAASMPPEVRFGLLVFMSLLLLGSTVAGVVRTLQVAYALSMLVDDVKYIPQFEALVTIRSDAAHMGAVSASLGLICWLHRSPPGRLGTRWSRFWVSLATGAVAAPIAALLTLLSSAATASAALGVDVEVYVTGLRHITSVTDVAFGFTRATLYAAGLGVAVAFVGPAVAHAPWRLRWKILLGWIATGALMGLIDVATSPHSEYDAQALIQDTSEGDLRKRGPTPQ